MTTDAAAVPKTEGAPATGIALVIGYSWGKAVEKNVVPSAAPPGSFIPYNPNNGLPFRYSGYGAHR